jgi:acyl-CoA-binding protein
VDTGFIPIGEAEKREADDELKHKFLEAANLARSGSVSIASNEVQLQLYGLYKQATIGVAVPTDLGFWDVVGKAKWEAWNKCGSMTKQEAMTKYVELVESLAGSSGGEKAGKQENKGWKSTSKMAEPDSPEKEETKVARWKEELKSQFVFFFFAGFLVSLS